MRADAPRPGPARAGQVEHDPAGQAAGQLAQALVGGAGQVGEQRERLVGVARQQLARTPSSSSSPDLGRDLARSAGGGPARGATSSAGPPRRPPRRRPSPSLTQVVGAGAPQSGRQAFPGRPHSRPARRRPRAHSSVTMSSERACRRPRAPAAARRARRARRRGRRSGRRPAARAARPAARPRSTRSMAPRTDEPMRRSGWSRVRRTSVDHLGQPRSVDRRLAGAAAARRSRASSSAVLVVHRQPAHAVVDGSRDAGRADRVERVHGRHQPEARARPRPDRAGARAARPRSSP